MVGPRGRGGVRIPRPQVTVIALFYCTDTNALLYAVVSPVTPCMEFGALLLCFRCVVERLCGLGGGGGGGGGV